MRRHVVKDGWRGFIELCAAIEESTQFNQMCDLFMTIEEKNTLASRYLIVKALLESKLTQREIAEKYEVSIAQITRGSNALKIIEPKLRSHLCALLKNR
jgi:TrpR family trp operon transcriptional repressor